MNRNRLKQLIENILYPLILILWPLVKYDQGVDISDSTYSLGNYLYPDNIQPMWKISTYLSNLIGASLLKLPGADRLAMANIYTGLFISIIGLSVYLLLRKQHGAWQVFLGEFISIGFCWIPSGILYNYLTYLLFSLGAVFLYMGISKGKDKLFILAGIMLGLNVFIRLPNILEVLLIIAVWAGSKKPVKDTLLCVSGFLVGVLIPIIIIISSEGFSVFGSMIQGLTAVSSNNEDYTLLGMIISCINAYIRSFKWLVGTLIITALGWGIFYLAKRMSGNSSRVLTVWLPSGVYICLIGLMLRLYWGRGMFSLRYFEDYTAITEWGMLVLFLGLIIAIIDLVSKKTEHDNRILAIIVLLIIAITPLGSNNYTFQNINNLFLIMPYIISRIWDRVFIKNTDFSSRYTFGIMSVAIAVVILIQTSLFHMNFVFRDGMDGTKRDTAIEGIASLEGMKTTSDNADQIEAIAEVIEECREKGVTEAIYWGDCPGLSYVLRMPSAIDTTWPDLGSYAYDYMEQQLINLAVSPQAEHTMLIVKSTDNDTDAYYNKLELLMDYARTKHMSSIYDENGYTIYVMP